MYGNLKNAKKGKIKNLKNSHKLPLTKDEINILQHMIDENSPLHMGIRDWLASLLSHGYDAVPYRDWSHLPSSKLLLDSQLRIGYCRNAADLVEAVLYSDIRQNSNALYRLSKLTDIELLTRYPVRKIKTYPITHVSSMRPGSRWLCLSILDVAFMPTVIKSVREIVREKIFSSGFSTKIFYALNDEDLQMEYLTRHIGKPGFDMKFLLHQCVYDWLTKCINGDFSLTKLTNFVLKLVRNGSVTVERLKRYRKPDISAFVENVIICFMIESTEPALANPQKMAQRPRRI